MRAGDTFELSNNQPDMMIVEMDPLFHRRLHCRPIGLLKPVLRARSDFQKAAILGVKPLQNHLSDQQFNTHKVCSQSKAGPDLSGPENVKRRTAALQLTRLTP